MNFQKYIICEFIAAGQHLAHSCKEWIFLCVGSLPYGITDCGVQKLSVPKSRLHPVYYKCTTGPKGLAEILKMKGFIISYHIAMIS